MGANYTNLEDGEHGEGGFVEADGELVGVPAVAGITEVGVDGTKEAHGGGGFRFVVEVVVTRSLKKIGHIKNDYMQV